MGKKRKIIFVIESLSLAGSERSLIALLSNLDPERYEIDLQLFHYGGELEQFLPSFVNILPPLSYTQFASQPLLENLKSNNFTYLWAKLSYSLNLRLRKRNHSEIAELYWKSVQNNFSIGTKVYDVAIAYAQGVPTFYVQDKIKASKKVCWVNANVQFTERNYTFQKSYYSRYDYIVPVSRITLKNFKNIFPELQMKLVLIPDMIDAKNIYKMAHLYESKLDINQFNILTVSRLEKGMKGLDITIEACRKLNEKKINFQWYILGKGSYQSTIEDFIKKNKLENNLKLLGTTPNPYPYFRAADLYVQTSRSESYGISIAEARLLNTPVVTTRFDTVFLQMVDGKNGLVTDMNAEAVANAIERIMKDQELYNSIVGYLKLEEKENIESVTKFNNIINRLLS